MDFEPKFAIKIIYKNDHYFVIICLDLSLDLNTNNICISITLLERFRQAKIWARWEGLKAEFLKSSRI